MVNENSDIQKAVALLRQIRLLLGRNYKSSIRDAWMTGNYSGHCLDQWSSELQQIRNTLGPSWLAQVRIK